MCMPLRTCKHVMPNSLSSAEIFSNVTLLDVSKDLGSFKSFTHEFRAWQLLALQITSFFKTILFDWLMDEADSIVDASCSNLPTMPMAAICVC